MNYTARRWLRKEQEHAAMYELRKQERLALL